MIGGSGRLVHLGGLDERNNSVGNPIAAAGDTVPQGSIFVNDTFIPSKNPDLVVAASIADESLTNSPQGLYIPGLRKGVVAGNAVFTGSNPDTSLQLSPHMGEYGVGNAQNNSTSTGLPWSQNSTWIYTGEFFDADGIISFGTALVPTWQLKIDGVIPRRPRNRIAANGPVAPGQQR